MARVGLLVMGPAGSGKSTFCGALIQHLRNIGRNVHLVNLDPAAENFEWEPTVDVRDLISLEDVMEEMDFGPNGGLVYCFEFLMQNLDWLEEELGGYEDEFLIFDMPGQIELYTHIPILSELVRHLQSNLTLRLCAAYLLESQFVVDRAKFFAGTLSAMSAMLMLEIPHVNVLSKMDLIRGQMPRAELKRFLNADALLLADEANAQTNPRFHDLNSAIVQLIDEFHMISFLPLESGDDESVAKILSYVDDATQWAEDQEPREPKEYDVEVE